MEFVQDVVGHQRGGRLLQVGAVIVVVEEDLRLPGDAGGEEDAALARGQRRLRAEGRAVVGRQAEMIAVAHARLEAAVIIGVGREQRQQVARHPAQLPFEAIAFRLAGIGQDELRALLHRGLEIIILIIKGRAIDEQGPVHEGCLCPQFETVDRLGIQHRKARVAQRGGRRAGGQHLRTAAARIGGVEAGVGAGLVPRGQAPGKAAVRQGRAILAAIAGRRLRAQAKERHRIGGRGRDGGGARHRQRLEQGGAHRLGLAQRADQPAQDRPAIVDRRQERAALVVMRVAQAAADLELVRQTDGDVAEQVEGAGARPVGAAFQMAGLQVRGDRLRLVGRQGDAIGIGDTLQQRAGESGIGQQGGGHRVARGAVGNDAAAVQRARQSGQRHALVKLRRHPLRALFVEIARAQEGGDRAILVGQAEFLAGLHAARILGRRQHRQRNAVRVENLQRVEPAEGGGGGEAEAIVQLQRRDAGDAPDLPVQPQRLAPFEPRARRERRAAVAAAVPDHRARHGIGRVVGDRFEPGAVRAVLLIIADQVEAEVALFAVEAAADRLGVDRVEVRAAQQIFDIAVALADAAGQAHRHAFADRRIDHRLAQPAVIIAVGDAPRRREAGRVRLVLHDVDRADQRAAPVERRLRPLGDLDPLDVEQLDIGAARLGDGDAVLEDGDARLVGRRAAVRRDAAHDEAGIVGRLVLHLEARHEAREGVEFIEAEAVELLGPRDAQRHRHVDRILFAQLRGDDDRIARIGLRLGDLGLRGGGGECGKADGGQRQRTNMHDGTPSAAPVEREYEACMTPAGQARFSAQFRGLAATARGDGPA